jgi:hypothetical protein
MRKLKFAYLLAFAPFLMGSSDTASDISGLVVNTLPICAENEYLTYNASGLACTTITAGGLPVPDCKKDDQLLTYTMTGEIGLFSCTPKGAESLSASDITTINTKYQELVNLETQIKNLENGMRSPAAKFCGLTSGTTSGRILNGTAVGIYAAAQLCAQVDTCGTGARMCSVYDMYHSAATGTLTQAQTVNKSWVYMAAWQNFTAGANEPTAGLNDNCGSYTYGTGDLAWRGTGVGWAPRNNGEKVLKFFTSNQAGGTLCSEVLPIACCK